MVIATLNDRAYLVGSNAIVVESFLLSIDLNPLGNSFNGLLSVRSARSLS